MIIRIIEDSRTVSRKMRHRSASRHCAVDDHHQRERQHGRKRRHFGRRGESAVHRVRRSRRRCARNGADAAQALDLLARTSRSRRDGAARCRRVTRGEARRRRQNSSTSSTPGTTPARNSRPIDVSVTRPYRIIVIDGGIRMPSVPPAQIEPVAMRRRHAAVHHLRHAGLADRRRGGRARPADRREQAAGEDVGDHESARHAVEPAVQRLVDVVARRRDADRCAQQDEEREW